MKKFALAVFAFLIATCGFTADKPNIILIMADDMGWGQTGYYNHPVLKTPNLDAMAKSGLRFDQFYAGASNCSPTRASVLTGRSNDRTGVFTHGFALRRQEKTIAQALQNAGYATGHFGKWHLNGLRGPGVPVLKNDANSPGAFGFETWLTVTNYFDLNPILSRKGTVEEFKGDSSEIIVSEALKFVEAQMKADKPSFSVIWYGSPHSPFRALKKDAAHFPDLNEKSREHYGELVAMDRSVGTLRAKLRELGIEKETLVWFCSDNGGLPEVTPSSVGNLRGFKNSLYEGGIRVPAIIEWPGKIKPRVTDFPACTMDILPTLVEVAALEKMKAMPHAVDGISLVPNFSAPIAKREKPIPFRHNNRGALVDGRFKVISLNLDKAEFQLFDLKADQSETTDVSEKFPEEKKRLVETYRAWSEGVNASVSGKDYETGKVDEQPPRVFWNETEAYKPYLKEWIQRPEYKAWMNRRPKKKKVK